MQKQEAINLKESGEACTGRFGGRGEKEEMF